MSHYLGLLIKLMQIVLDDFGARAMDLDELRLCCWMVLGDLTGGLKSSCEPHGHPRPAWRAQMWLLDPQL